MNGTGAKDWIKGKGGFYIPAAAMIAVVVATYINMSNQTAIAIDVARQHGEEMRLLRDDYTQLHGEMVALQNLVLNAADDRFRGKDAEKMEARIMDRIKLVEKRMDKNGI